MDKTQQNCTRVFYYLNDDIPFLIKVDVPPNEVTLADFKRKLKSNINLSDYKFFFKTYYEDVGIVKEEIINDNSKLPFIKGKVYAFLEPQQTDNSQANGYCSSNSNSANQNSKFMNANRNFRNLHCDTSDCETTETESVISNQRDRRFNSNHHHNSKNHFNRHCCNESIGLTTDIDSTTFVDTDDESFYQCPNDEDDYENDLDDCDNQSSFSTTSEETSISRVAQNRLKKKKRLLHLAKLQARASSVASMTDSNVSLDVITVTLNLTKGNFLGISIYGQCYPNGDNGIYVGSIMERGVVQQDGRIDVGDMILQVNDVNFENVSNDEAVAVLRKAVSKLGQIKLVVAKHNWLRSLNVFGKPPEQMPDEDTLNLKNQPVRPIDPRAWVEHTKQITKSSKDANNPEIDINNIQLTTKMEMLSIARAMSAPDSGLEIKDRTWLKIIFPNSFLGSDVVNWLYSNVNGFNSKKEAKKYAANLLKNGYIKHTLNKSSFSEQCYYTFSELVVYIPSMENLNLNDDSQDRIGTEINYGLKSQDNPQQFLPYTAQNTVSYGVFEAPSVQDNASNHASNYKGSNSVESSEKLSQISGPIPISNFQQQMKTHQQQQLFYSNLNQSSIQQQQPTTLHHPPFAPQPIQQQSQQSSNFFNQFESNHLRAASSNSSETQSSLNTLSTRDTAIGVSNGLISNQNLSNNQLRNNVLSNLLSNNGLTHNNLQHNNGLSNLLHNNNLSNNLTNDNLNSNNLLINNGLQNNGFNGANVHLNNNHSLITGSEINGHSNEINDDNERLIIDR